MADMQQVSPLKAGLGGGAPRRTKVREVLAGEPSAIVMLMDHPDRDALSACFNSDADQALVPIRDRGFKSVNIWNAPAPVIARFAPGLAAAGSGASARQPPRALTRAARASSEPDTSSRLESTGRSPSRESANSPGAARSRASASLLGRGSTAGRSPSSKVSRASPTSTSTTPSPSSTNGPPGPASWRL